MKHFLKIKSYARGTHRVCMEVWVCPCVVVRRLYVGLCVYRPTVWARARVGVCVVCVFG